MLIVTLLLAGFAAGTSVANATAPRDALANMPSISNDTYIESTDVQKDGVTTQSEETFDSQWDVLWVPPRLRLGTGGLETRVDYRHDVRDENDHISALADFDQSGDQFDVQLNLTSGELVAQHHFYRRDLQSPAGSDQSLLSAIQNMDSSLSYRLPFGLSVSVSDHITLNYPGPPGLNEHGSEAHNTEAKLEYRPAKVALGQFISASVQKTESRVPSLGTGNEGLVQQLDVQRDLPLGNLGKLNWNYTHREESNSGAIAGPSGAATSTSDTQLVSLEGAVKDSPVSYRVSYSDTTAESAVGNPRQRQVNEVRLFLRPVSNGSRTTSLEFRTTLDHNLQPGNPGNDTENLQNWMAWKFAPHRRIDSSVQYLQNRITNNIERRLDFDRDRLDADVTYRMPSNRGGALYIHLWEDEQAGTESGFTENGVELRNQVVLSKAASVTLNYSAYSHADDYPGVSLPVTTDYISTGVGYEVTPGNQIYLRGQWQQGLRLRNDGQFRADTGHMDIDLSYRPDWQWQYSLHIDGDNEAVSDLVTGSSHSNRDQIHASVSFRF